MNRKKISLIVVIMCCAAGYVMNINATEANDNSAAEEVTYENHAKGIRIVPGRWRPHYHWEHIAWISPSWPSQDYIWLDFTEDIFANGDLLFQSHIDPRYPALFEGMLGKVEWQQTTQGICFQRTLPNGVTFGGSLKENCDSTGVAMEIYIYNGTKAPLKNIQLQTCSYLRAIKEFADFTADNKYVHLPKAGWLPFNEAREQKSEKGRFRLGWRGGPKLADLPVMVVPSNKAERLMAMTWYDSTYSLIHNADHPCMHADPVFGDIKPGKKAAIHGEILFFEGTLDQFTPWFKKRYKQKASPPVTK